MVGYNEIEMKWYYVYDFIVIITGREKTLRICITV